MSNRTRLIFSLALVAISWFVGEAFANPRCSAIDNPDDRAYCRAVARNSTGECTTIGSYNLRGQCRARVTAKTTVCSALTSPWEREKCKDAARAGRR